MDRVIDYYEKRKPIVPIHIDCGITKICNMTCTYCYGKMQDMNGSIIERDALINNLVKSAAKIGVKSLGFIGDGEPTMNPACFEALAVGKAEGLSMAISTNGILVDTYLKQKTILESCDWMRFNISAYTEVGYRNIHKSSKRDIVFQNVRDLVKLQKELGTKCDIGIQMVFDPATMLDEVIPLSKFAVDSGVNYFVIKQCSLPDDGETGIAKVDLTRYTDEDVVKVLKKAESLSTEATQIIPKWNILAMEKKAPYKRCLSIPLISEISGDGGWYPCGYFFGGKRKDMCFGNVHDNTLEEIIRSTRYWSIIEHLELKHEVGVECKGMCRQEMTNIFIDEYVNNRPQGLNFI
jgi:MoaA/NifB/PqqE/SkfB family radical SAM enzyme